MSKFNHQFLGDRHLRPVEGLKGVVAGRRGSVLLRLSPAICETPAGQHTIWMLANLLSRQFGVIDEVRLAIPRVVRHPAVALYGAMPILADTVRETIKLVAGALITIREAQEADPPADIEVVIGRAETASRSAVQIGVVGCGWRTAAGMPSLLPDAPSNDPNPLGPFFAACLAAGEVFKRCARLDEERGRYIGDLLSVSLWDFEGNRPWADTADAPWPVGLCLPPAYLIGAGAVGQAMLAGLTASGLLTGYVTVIDGDTIDETNLNRYPLATRNDLDAAKAAFVANRLSGRGISFYPADVKWPDYALAPTSHIGQRDDLLKQEASYRYPLVLSCVDRNTPRHAIQNYWPEYIIGGSTKDLACAVAAYDPQSDYECLKCHNPPEPKGPTMEEVAVELRKFSSDERQRRAVAIGADPVLVESGLRDGGCGKLGQAEILKFAQPNPDWSVGFVSVASGILLAAQTIKFAMMGRAAFPQEKGNTLRFSFLNPGALWTKHRRNLNCDCVGQSHQT